MSETNIKKGNPVPACGSLETGAEVKGLQIVDGAMGPSRTEVTVQPGMEIPAVADVITNETPDGRTVVIDPATGKEIGILQPDGTISRHLEEIDKKKRDAKDDRSQR